jgi:Uma2 family endonuclease
MMGRNPEEPEDVRWRSRPRRRFTLAEYYRMGEVGILGEHDRVELIEGEIVQMSLSGNRHIAFVINLSNLLAGRLAGRALVSTQNPVVLTDDTEPQPDVTVLRRRAYKDRRVSAADVALLIEVADTSLSYDRRTKLPLYAQAGIPEYWIVDCTAEAVEVYRNPSEDRYRDVSRFTAPATLSLQALPDVTLTLAEIFA